MSDTTPSGRRPLFDPRNNRFARKLAFFTVEEIREMARNGIAKAAIARRFGVSRSLVSLIASGKRWRVEPTLPPAEPEEPKNASRARRRRDAG